MDGTNYAPAADVLERLGRFDFVAVVGPTAVGKTSVIRAAMTKSPELHMVLMCTSRPPRPGEQDGVDYFFSTREEMEPRIARGEFVQVAPAVLGDLYGSPPEAYTAQGVNLAAVVSGAVPVFRALPFRSVRTVFILPPDARTWQKRLAAHNFTSEQLARRMTEARDSLRFALEDPYTLFVINDMIDRAAQDFITLVFGERVPQRLQQDQHRAPAIVRDLLDRITTSE